MPRAPPSASPHPSTFLPLPTRTPPRSTLFPYTTLFRSREDQQMVYTLRALKPDLAETKVYVDPPPGRGGCGHTFSRRVNMETLEREDSAEQIDSWNRTWTFFEWNLRPLRH